MTSHEYEIPLDLTPLGAASAAQKHAPEAIHSLFMEPEGQLASGRMRAKPKARTLGLTILAYVLGGIAPAALGQTRWRFALVGSTLAGVLPWAAMVWRWSDVRAGLESGRWPFVPWLAGVAVASVLLVAAWSRAVRLAGRDLRFVPGRIPRLVRNPAVATLFGLLFPGSGLLMAGFPRRAALFCWHAGVVVMSSVVLWRADWLWKCNVASDARGLPPIALECALILAALLAFCGALGWVAGALDGARHVSNRAGRDASARADWLAFGVVGALIALCATFGPRDVARNLHHFTPELQQQGYALIPLCLELSATRLDPSQPRYAMQAAELYDALGQAERARVVREQLQERWAAYAEMLLRQDVSATRVAPPALIGAAPPVEDTAPQPQAAPDRPAVASEK